MNRGEPDHNGELFRSLAENNPGIVFQVVFHRETGFRLVYICERVQTLLGFTPDQLREDPSKLTDQVPQAEKEKISALFEEGVKDCRPFSFEVEVDTRQGRRWYQAHVIPYFKDAASCRFNGVALDITDQKQKEDQLQQAQKMEALGALAGGVAHDFNNILSAVIGYTELSLEAVQKGTLLHKNLTAVLDAGNRARELVKQILAISRNEEKENKYIAIPSLVKEAVKLLRSVIPSSIEIRESMPSEQLVVNADPTQVHQVIVNLITNAKQAMAENQGVIDIRIDSQRLDESSGQTFPDMAPGEYARIRVSDTGSGIPAHYLDRIFDPYFTTKEKGVGTGLGLSVVHGIIKTHKGAITVDSESGRGATFTIYLPLAEKPRSRAQKQAETPLPKGEEHILLVDDEPAILEMQAQILEHLGYRITTKDSSEDALEAFQAQPRHFDLIITDMTMPKMTGDQLAAAIKRIQPKTPVLLCTGFSEQISANDRNPDIDDFLMKPVDRRKMAETIRRLLNTRHF